MSTHLSIRVPWHDSIWNGRVCEDPASNCHCVDYENILKHKDTEWELSVVGKSWEDMTRVPPCARESGGFLAPHRWISWHEHPYKNNSKVKETHAYLEKTPITVEPYTAIAAPFFWLNRENVDEYVQPRVTDPLPPEEPCPPGFNTTWIFNPALQEAVLKGFFDPVSTSADNDDALAIFYTKGNHPVSDDTSRLIVGIADITGVSKQRHYDSPEGKRQHPIWERAVQHSLRKDASGGFLLPFHQYLEPTGDSDEDKRRRDLAQHIIVEPEPDRIREFSFRSEHVSADSVISVLTQALASVDQIRQDGIANGDWAATESWLNDRLARAWRLRGPSPGIGVVLEAMGLKLGTSLCFSLAQSVPQFADDPWPTIGAILAGKATPPHERFLSEIDAFRSTWQFISSESTRLELARCLAQFALSADQAKRWWDSKKRDRSLDETITDDAIIENPYMVVEHDLGGGGNDHPVSFTTIDRGMLSDLGGHPKIASGDRRRRRSALTSILRRAASDGDTLLGVAEARCRVEEIPVAETIELPQGWIEAEGEFLAERITAKKEPFEYVQLNERSKCAFLLQRKLRARALKKLKSPDADWRELLIATIEATLDDPDNLDLDDARVKRALKEQADALKVITSRKLTCLVGRAGTGKTTLLGALSRAPAYEGDLLFLAPTGKARVRLESRVAEGTAVKTAAQFLYENKRYDGRRQRPIIGDPCYDGHQTIVIDESSMLTEDDVAAVLSTFTNRVKRLILVGDPAQLPPIGPGRPFADLVSFLDPFDDDPEKENPDEVELRRGAIARLQQEVRTFEGSRSDTLRLANWFTNDKPSPDAESIFSSLTDGSTLNDLDVHFWNAPDELHTQLQSAMKKHLGIDGSDDLKGFNESLLMQPFKSGWTTGDPAGAERWQVLSPVRGEVWGCDDLNRWIKQTWRGKALSKAREYHSTFGPQEILKHDKVILRKNGERDGYSYVTKETSVFYLANGEVALAKSNRLVPTKKGKSHVMNLVFAGRPEDQSFGFWKWEFGGETGPGIIELAYALTVHKAQGSEFGVVFVILPKGRMAYRELIYTGLTRSRKRLVLLVQGNDVSDLLRLRHPGASDTNQRNSNVFYVSVRDLDSRPFAQHLVHRAEDGQLLRSKSELFIYSQCLANGLRPRYEERFDGDDGRWKLPDFTFEDDAGDPIIWEHLGMMDDLGYADDWEKKRNWYEEQGVVEGENLFWTDEVGGLDAAKVSNVIAKIKEIVG